VTRHKNKRYLFNLQLQNSKTTFPSELVIFPTILQIKRKEKEKKNNIQNKRKEKEKEKK